MVISTLPFVIGFAAIATPLVAAQCDTVQHGYQCNTHLSHNWGQYSPFFSVNSDISTSLPDGCHYTFVNVISRHGARNPTSSKTKSYSALISKIHNMTTSYSPDYAFLKNYTYTLGADNLTPFGQQEMHNSGEKFFSRYASLTRTQPPFTRSSSDQRVVESAQNFTQGYGAACDADSKCQTSNDYASYYDNIVIISEAAGSNDTLDSSTCPAFEASSTNSAADLIWEQIFLAPIQARLNSGLKGANLTLTESLYMMDLCPFNTVQGSGNTLSPFCSLFTVAEWKQYNYLRSLDKWYADGYGVYPPLGPSQGVGFANELLARMTGDRSYVNRDVTNVNHTLDSSPVTFPLNTTSVYADFSHDDPMISIFSALGLFNATLDSIGLLSNTTLQDVETTMGYSAGHSVPFAGRAYFEKMVCPKTNGTDELVRVVMNDRIVPLVGCGADDRGRCTLKNWMSTLSFVAQGGLWKQC